MQQDKEQIREGEEKIAVFMGGEKRKGGPYGYFFTGMEGKGACDPYDFKYHSSWDWIMPVCKKLNFLAENKIIKHSKNYDYWCDQLDNAVTRAYDINQVFPVVVDFIDYHKSNPS